MALLSCTGLSGQRCQPRPSPDRKGPCHSPLERMRLGVKARAYLLRQVPGCTWHFRR